MASSSSAATKPAEAGTATGGLGLIVQEWRQWITPGILVAVVLAMGQAQRADIQQLSSKIDQVNGRIDEVRTELSADIRGLSGRIDRTNDRIDRANDRMDQLFQLYRELRP